MVIGVCTACFRVFMFYSRIETGINYTHIFKVKKKKIINKNKKKVKNKWAERVGSSSFPFFFYLSLSLDHSLYHHPGSSRKWWSKHIHSTLLLRQPSYRRRRSAVARVTTTLLLKPRRGTTERERVLWPVYLDNPTCRIRIEKGSRSLSLFFLLLANLIVKKNLSEKR